MPPCPALTGEVIPNITSAMKATQGTLVLLLFFLSGFAALVLFPPAFLMGGTLPLMSAHLIHNSEELGRMGTVLYAVTTAGSALGVIAAGFFLPVVLGFRVTYVLAVSIDLLVGVSAVLISRSRLRPNDIVALQPIRMRTDEAPDVAVLRWLTGCAGLRA